jgi:hypothetical protein
MRQECPSPVHEVLSRKEGQTNANPFSLSQLLNMPATNPGAHGSRSAARAPQPQSYVWDGEGVGGRLLIRRAQWPHSTSSQTAITNYTPSARMFASVIGSIGFPSLFRARRCVIASDNPILRRFTAIIAGTY